jgi:hypothetical protein
MTSHAHHTFMQLFFPATPKCFSEALDVYGLGRIIPRVQFCPNGNPVFTIMTNRRLKFTDCGPDIESRVRLQSVLTDMKCKTKSADRSTVCICITIAFISLFLTHDVAGITFLANANARKSHCDLQDQSRTVLSDRFKSALKSIASRPKIL